MLCNSLAEHKAGINRELIIESDVLASAHLCHIPYHHLPYLADTLACASQVPILAAARTAYRALPSLDKHVLANVYASLPTDHKALLNAAQSLTMQSAANRWTFYGIGDGKCPFCGSSDSGIIHEAWMCPELKKVQLAEDDYLQVFAEGSTPLHTLLGTQAAMHMDYDNMILDAPDGHHVALQCVPDFCCDATLNAEAAALMGQHKTRCHNQGNSFAHLINAILHPSPPLFLLASHPW